MFTTILALTGMLSGLGALALGWHALSRARVVGSESQALAQRAAAVSASGVDPLAVRDVAVLHYDALEEMSGARSFSLALLNSEGDGVVVTSINGRTESRTYAKPVVGGECDTLLSPEEYRVVRSARLGEGVGATAAAEDSSVQPVSRPVVREAPEPPAARDEERGAREDAEAAADTVEAVDAGPDRERGGAAAPTATTAQARTGTVRTGTVREHAETTPAAPGARTTSTAQANPSTPAAPAAPSDADERREAAEAPETAEPTEAAPPAPAAPAVPAARTAPPATAASAAEGEEREPRGLASVLRRTIGRVGTDHRAPVEAVRSGVGAARPVLSANVTVRPGPSANVTVQQGSSATGAGRTGPPSAGTATAAEPCPADRTGGEAGQDGAREADAPAPEARG
ncbi:hypothetical protein CQJ94_06475 [Glycomyces fuscus]|nr:hypothetical protein CQJ94_06475 [Glycomyces fuscus]